LRENIKRKNEDLMLKISNPITSDLDPLDELGKELHMTDLRFYISSNNGLAKADSKSVTKGFVDIERLDDSEWCHADKVLKVGPCKVDPATPAFFLEMSKVNTHHLGGGYDLMNFGAVGPHTERRKAKRDVGLRSGDRELNMSSRSYQGVFDSRHVTRHVIARGEAKNILAGFGNESRVVGKKKNPAQKIAIPQKFGMKNTSIEQFKLKRSHANRKPGSEVKLDSSQQSRDNTLIKSQGITFVKKY
jgi:hypothetical protein